MVVDWSRLKPLGPVTLQGQTVRLEPLTQQHRDGLWAVAQTPEIWDHLLLRLDTPEAVEEFVAAKQTAAREYAFAVVLAASGQVAGCTTYLEVDEVNRTVEVGGTWYAPDVWGTKVNPEAKLLLLRHAFEDWGALRVSLLTDIRNLHSQAAIRKLGAKYEGTIRRHRIRRDGSLRDSVLFSILKPDVKAGLLARAMHEP